MAKRTNSTGCKETTKTGHSTRRKSLRVMSECNKRFEETMTRVAIPLADNLARRQRKENIKNLTFAPAATPGLGKAKVQSGFVLIFGKGFEEEGGGIRCL